MKNPFEDGRRTVQHLMSKYGGSKPVNRDTVTVRLTLDFGCCDSAFSAKGCWFQFEFPGDWVASKTIEEVDVFMEKVKGAAELLFAGTMRLIWEEEKRDIMQAAVLYGKHYLKEKFEENDDE